MRVECVFCAYAKVAWASRPLCERAPVIPARGLISKGNTRVNLLQGTLSQAGTPALPSHRSPFHQNDPRAPPLSPTDYASLLGGAWLNLVPFLGKSSFV